MFCEWKVRTWDTRTQWYLRREHLHSRPNSIVAKSRLITRHLLSLVAEIGSSLLHCIFLKQGPYWVTHRQPVSTHKEAFVIQKLKFSRAIKVFNQEWMISVPDFLSEAREPPYGAHKPSSELISKNVPISDSLLASLSWANALSLADLNTASALSSH